MHLAAVYMLTRSTELGSSNDIDCRTVSDPAKLSPQQVVSMSKNLAAANSQ
jgi:hypothetical protein